MTLKDLFKKHSKADYSQKKDIDNLKEDLKLFRQNQQSINQEEANFLSTLLDNSNNKWFSAYILGAMETFPKSLISELVETSLNEKDPSFNSYFITPCIRVYNPIETLKVIENKRLTTEEEMFNLLSTLYHVHSWIISIGKFNSNSFSEVNWESIGVKYTWDETTVSYIKNPKKNQMSKSEFDTYLPSHKEFTKRKKELILKVKNLAKSNELKNYASKMLG